MSDHERLPWPMMYRHASDDDSPFTAHSVQSALEHLEACGEGVWRCHELDRSDAEGQPVFAATAGALTPFAAETHFRLGKDSSRRFIAAVQRDDPIDDEHAGLMANVRRRFGDVGLQRFAFFLESLCDELDDGMADVKRGSQ